MINDWSDRARTLRRAQTKEERKLWYDFLCTYPIQFRRQVVFVPYIADFYAHQVKLAIELDGSGHYEPEQSEYDLRRTEYLKEKYGISVLRFSNTDIDQNFAGVCEQIDLLVKACSKKASPGGSWHGASRD